MGQLQPYVFFDGSCEEALHFYEEVFDGKISDLQRFSNMLQDEKERKDKGHLILHAKFTFWGGEFFASDTGADAPGDWKDQNIHISVTCDTVEQGRIVHQKLSAGGQITGPYKKEFWGDYFGSLIDKYNIRWMVDASGT